MKNLIYLCGLLALVCCDVYAQNIQRVRLDLQTPLGYTRQLLLGFTPDNAASDDFDYGYDAPNIDEFPDDFSWMIEDERYIIQGVGEFDTSKKYPIGFFLSNDGDISINLNALENFQEPIDVYIYDAYDNSYTLINAQDFTTYQHSGTSTDRYFIAFETQNSNESLSLNEVLNPKDIGLQFNKLTNILNLKLNTSVFLKSVEIYNQLGQKLINLNYQEANNRFSMPLSGNLSEEILILKIHTDHGTVTKSILL